MKKNAIHTANSFLACKKTRRLFASIRKIIASTLAPETLIKTRSLLSPKQLNIDILILFRCNSSTTIEKL